MYIHVHDVLTQNYLTLGILMRTLPPVPCFPRASDCMVLLNSPSSGERGKGEEGGKEVKISTEGRAVPEPTDVSDFLDVSEHDFVRSVKEQQNKCLEQRHLQLLLTLWNGMRVIRHCISL